MKFKYRGVEDWQFLLAFETLSDKNGSYGFLLELFRHRWDFHWRKHWELQYGEWVLV